jgi:hypothetical protein
MTRHRSVLIAAIALAVLIAGCGGSNSGSPGSGADQPHAPSLGVLRFTSCVRSHGVPNLPDPGRDWKNILASQAPAVVAAERTCDRLFPGVGPLGQSQSQTHTPAQVAAMLAFARCIRSHGFPNFPDPTSSGDVTHQMVANAGINLHQPAVLQAGDTCTGVTHGIITRTTVARFVAGQ